MRFLSIIVLLLVTLLSCKEQYAEDKQPVAEVMNKYLYRAEVEAFIPAGTPKRDSISTARGYVRNWITKELMLSNAIKTLTEEEKRKIREQVEDYSSSLLIHKYKEKFVSQKMDQTVNDNEIDDYYIQNKINFILSHPVVRALLIIIPKPAQNLPYLQECFRSDAPEALKSLEEYCITNAKKYDDFGNRWMELRYLLNFLPVDRATWETRYKNSDRVELEDNEYYYFFRINKIVREHEIAPVDYVKQEIELILRNKRKMELEETLERYVNEEGIRRNLVKIHE
jgi:hypothetical protein